MSENENKIEDIKRKLYEPVDHVTHRTKEGVIHPVSHNAPEEWRNEELNNSFDNMKKPHTSIFKKFFIFAIIFFLGAIGFAFYMFYTGGTSVSNDNIEISVIGSAFTKGGEDLPLQVEIVNKNKASLELANLMVSYPSGASDDISSYSRLPKIPIGTIKPGETITKNIKVVLYGDEKSNRTVKIDFDYHPEGSNAIFSKPVDYIVNISLSPLSLTVDAPSNVTSDQPISFKVDASLNTTLPSEETFLQVKYPNNFIYESATPAPAYGDSTWSLSELSLTNPVSVVIKGRIVGEDKDQQVFHVYAGTSKESDKSSLDVVYNSLAHTVEIVKPFLEANILVNDTSSPGDVVPVKIAWKNNLSTRITDGEIIANLGGNVFDRSSVIASQGFYDSANNRIIWDKNSIPALSSIEPGEKGEVDFSVKSISLVGGQTAIKDPQLTFDVSIKGKQPSFGSTYSDVDNFSKKIVKMVSDLQIATSASYRSGPLPPKAENETDYDVTWTISNGTNSISNTTARAQLPVYVKWIGSVSTRENITYNESTREVVWNIGTIRANTGGNYNREVTFTIGLNPSLSQVGSTPQLMKELYISGTDAFTGTVVNNRRGFISTLLVGDSHFQSGFERVVK